MSRDFITYALLTGIGKGLQFLLLPLLTRLFSPADYGFIDILATLTSLTTILFSLSLESALARFWHERDEVSRRHLMTATTLFVGAVGAAGVAVAAMLSPWLSLQLAGSAGHETEVLLAVGIAWLMSMATLPQMALRMDRRIVKFGALQILNTALGVVLGVWLIVGAGLQVRGLLLGYAAAAGVTLLLGLFWVRDSCFFGLPSWQTLRESLRYGLPLVPAVLINWFSAQTDRIVLLTLLGLGVVGLYGAAAKVAMIVAVAAEVFRMAWLPLAMREISSPGRGQYFRRSLAGYLTAMVALGLVIASFAHELLGALTTTAYAEGYAMICWLVGAQVFYGAASITNVGMLISKRTGGNSIAAAISAAVNLAVCVILVSTIGAPGAAIGSCISALLFATLLLVLSRREVHIPFALGHAGAVCLLFVGVSACTLWLYDWGPDTLAARVALLCCALALLAALALPVLRRGATTPLVASGSAG